MPEDQLLAELIALRAEVGGLVDRVASPEKENTTLYENQEIQLKLINQLRDASRKAPESTMPAISSYPIKRNSTATWHIIQIR